MIDTTMIFIGAVFALAGLTKGVIGLGLPTVSMGLLAVIMAPVQAAALLVVPSLVTNLWQMSAGPSLSGVARRLWPMMLAVCLGTWAGAGLMADETARYSEALLGVALVIYAAMGLSSVRLSVRATDEWWLGPLAGAATGLVTAATGVFVIPAVPYLQAIGFEKEELVQALGLSFTISTIALALNLTRSGALDFSLSAPAAGALVTACAGMWLGQLLRKRMHPEVFRRWFFAGLALLGIYLVAVSLF